MRRGSFEGEKNKEGACLCFVFFSPKYQINYFFGLFSVVLVMKETHPSLGLSYVYAAGDSFKVHHDVLANVRILVFVLHFIDFEDIFDNTDFCGGSIETAECSPIVYDKTSSNYV